MDISFSDKKLEKLANNDRMRVATLGKLRADKLKQRLDDLRKASTLEDVRYLPGNWHELTENRKGQWACDLDQPYRLVFEPNEKPVPTDEHGVYLWIEIKSVEVIGIVNYHKEK
jgi:toxin HigB-1